jgi:hypothetical protein
MKSELPGDGSFVCQDTALYHQAAYGDRVTRIFSRWTRCFLPPPHCSDCLSLAPCPSLPGNLPRGASVACVSFAQNDRKMGILFLFFSSIEQHWA